TPSRQAVPRSATPMSAPTRRTASSMISLPMYSVTIGISARSRRRPSVARVSGRLVAQISRRNGGRLRRAPTRSRRLGRGLAGEGVGTRQTYITVPRRIVIPHGPTGPRLYNIGSPARDSNATVSQSAPVSIRQEDLVQSIADALQYISYYHP